MSMSPMQFEGWGSCPAVGSVEGQTAGVVPGCQGKKSAQFGKGVCLAGSTARMGINQAAADSMSEEEQGWGVEEKKDKERRVLRKPLVVPCLPGPRQGRKEGGRRREKCAARSCHRHKVSCQPGVGHAAAQKKNPASPFLSQMGEGRASKVGRASLVKIVEEEIQACPPEGLSGKLSSRRQSGSPPYSVCLFLSVCLPAHKNASQEGVSLPAEEEGQVVPVQTASKRTTKQEVRLSLHAGKNATKVLCMACLCSGRQVSKQQQCAPASASVKSVQKFSPPATASGRGQVPVQRAGAVCPSRKIEVEIERERVREEACRPGMPVQNETAAAGKSCPNAWCQNCPPGRHSQSSVGGGRWKSVCPCCLWKSVPAQGREGHKKGGGREKCSCSTNQVHPVPRESSI